MFSEDQLNQIKELLDPIHERLDAQRDQINKVHDQLSKQISRESKDLAEIIGSEVFYKLDNHEKRIKELEQIRAKSSKH